MLGRFELGLFYPSARSVHMLSEAAFDNPDPCVLANHTAMAQAAEQAGLDYAFLADSWGAVGPEAAAIEYMDPVLFAPLVAPVLFAATQRIRIVTTMHLTWLHPLVVARMGACLDQLSGGRWGLNMVAGAGFNEDLAASANPITDHDARYEAADEAIQIILQVWQNRGRVDFDGKHYTVHGGLVGPYPVQQPHPALISAGASGPGRAIASKYASYVFLPGKASKEMITQRKAQIREGAEAAGRDPDDIKFLLHASVLVRETQEEVDEAVRHLRAGVKRSAVAEYMAAMMSGISTYRDVYENYTEDQIAELGLTAGSMPIHGCPDYVAERLAGMKDDLGCDGVSLSFPITRPEEVGRFASLVVPILEKEKVWAPAL